MTQRLTKLSTKPNSAKSGPLTNSLSTELVVPQPFLKWAGGKKRLVPAILQMIPVMSGTYFEPFLGAGAVMFAQPLAKQKVVSDFNEELVNVYLTIRDDVEELIENLRIHTNSQEYFTEIRNLDRDGSFVELPKVARASRFIFLNRTCFNGLYRVNSKGQFNVPFGRYKNPDFVQEKLLRSVSNFLNMQSTSDSGGYLVDIHCGDFAAATQFATTGDFVYFDPPYEPLSSTSAFVSYQSGGFSQSDQRRLCEEMKRLTSLGVYVLQSNSSTELIHSLYSDRELFEVQELEVHRGIGAKSSSRGTVTEVFISNFCAVRKLTS